VKAQYGGVGLEALDATFNDMMSIPMTFISIIRESSARQDIWHALIFSCRSCCPVSSVFEHLRDDGVRKLRIVDVAVELPSHHRFR